MEVRYPNPDELAKIIEHDTTDSFPIFEENKYYLAAFENKKIVGYISVAVFEDTLFTLNTQIFAKDKNAARKALVSAGLNEAKEQGLSFLDFVYRGQLPDEVKALDYANLMEVEIGGEKAFLRSFRLKEAKVDEMTMLIMTTNLGFDLLNQMENEEWEE